MVKGFPAPEGVDPDDEGAACCGLDVETSDGTCVRRISRLSKSEADAVVAFASALASGLLDVGALKFIAGIVEGAGPNAPDAEKPGQTTLDATKFEVCIQSGVNFERIVIKPKGFSLSSEQIEAIKKSVLGIVGEKSNQIEPVDLVAEIKALQPNAEQAEAIATFAHVVVKDFGGKAFIRELVAGLMMGGKVYLPECKVPSSWALTQARRIAACISEA
ncbi:hypothetical protein [Thalassospira sp. MCCC 1A01428]|uniref:hypothetical protein n=1 Tax=Thalassospira sp. MCCC 1A01428 TaxID=1470575 RepID=UPI000A1FF6AA|nr:hypothetical protein [Thalassospira sp. MCCC 1A01428]OSQ45569.1 hypothetical protein THS27_04380 [Thalassospira sp. MCCC 1A01428]